MITMEYPPVVGGIASYVHQLSRALHGNEVIVLAPKHKDAADGADNFKTIRNNFFFPGFVWPRWLRLFFQVWRIVKKEKIDIIYLHHVLPVGYVAFLIKKLKKVPYVIFSHGTDISAALKNNWKKRMMKMVTNSAEQIILNSESLKGRLLERLPELADKSTVIYPCPEDIFYEPLSEELKEELLSRYALEGKKIVLSVGRLADGKGFPHLIRVMPKILEKNPNIVWFIIGDGPKKDFILEEIQKNNLQNVVRFIGGLPHYDLHKYYAIADLFVLLTHPDEGMEEGLGLVFLEAAAAGLPVVAGRSGGVEEAVVHTKTGIVVDAYQDITVVSAVTELLSNENFAKSLGQNAQERMRAIFRWDHQLKNLEPWL